MPLHELLAIAKNVQSSYEKRTHKSSKEIIDLLKRGKVYEVDSQDGYSGQFLHEVGPHGVGEKLYDNGDRYVGEFRNGKREGKGTYFYKKSGNKYDGYWKEGHAHGYGIFTYKNGCRYSGTFRKGKMHGKGLFTTPSGFKYAGHYEEGVRCGEGKVTFSSGHIYEGTFRNNKFDGFGTFKFKTGECATGTWKENALIEGISVGKDGVFKDVGTLPLDPLKQGTEVLETEEKTSLSADEETFVKIVVKECSNEHLFALQCLLLYEGEFTLDEACAVLRKTKKETYHILNELKDKALIEKMQSDKDREKYEQQILEAQDSVSLDTAVPSTEKIVFDEYLSKVVPEEVKRDIEYGVELVQISYKVPALVQHIILDQIESGEETEKNIQDAFRSLAAYYTDLLTALNSAMEDGSRREIAAIVIMNQVARNIYAFMEWCSRYEVQIFCDLLTKGFKPLILFCGDPISFQMLCRNVLERLAGKKLKPIATLEYEEDLYEIDGAVVDISDELDEDLQINGLAELNFETNLTPGKQKLIVLYAICYSDYLNNLSSSPNSLKPLAEEGLRLAKDEGDLQLQCHLLSIKSVLLKKEPTKNWEEIDQNLEERRELVEVAFPEGTEKEVNRLMLRLTEASILLSKGEKKKQEEIVSDVIQRMFALGRLMQSSFLLFTMATSNMGDTKMANLYANALLTLGRLTKVHVHMAYCMFINSFILLIKEQYTEFFKMTDACITVCLSNRSPTLLSLFLSHLLLAAIFKDRIDKQKLRVYGEKLLLHSRSIKRVISEVVAHISVGESCLSLKKREEGVNHLKRVVDLVERAGDELHELEIALKMIYVVRVIIRNNVPKLGVKLDRLDLVNQTIGVFKKYDRKISGTFVQSILGYFGSFDRLDERISLDSIEYLWNKLSESERTPLRQCFYLYAKGIYLERENVDRKLVQNVIGMSLEASLRATGLAKDRLKKMQAAYLRAKHERGQYAKPQWVEDKDQQECAGCLNKFTLTRRRHHCRMCGKIFCAKCSMEKIPLPPEYGDYVESQRVCDHCYSAFTSGTMYIKVDGLLVDKPEPTEGIISLANANGTVEDGE